jgi:hypothetical protein
VQSFEIRKRGTVEKRERAVVTAAEFQDVPDFAEPREADKNRNVRGVII